MLKALIRRAVRSMLRCVPLSLWQLVFPKDVICLCYHMVSDEPVPHLRFYRFKTSRQFADDLDAIKRRYSFVDYVQLRDRREELKHRVLLTFDDGFAEWFTVVRPILLKRRIPCVFFVTTDFVDNRTMFFESKESLCVRAIESMTEDAVRKFTAQPAVAQAMEQERTTPSRAAQFRRENVVLPDWLSATRREIINWLVTLEQEDSVIIDMICREIGVDVEEYLREHRPYLTTQQLRQMAADGFTIGAHGLSHRNLNGLSDAEVWREVAESCRVIREITGQRTVPFAFPYSGESIKRELLKQIAVSVAGADLFFDSGGLRSDAACVINRVSAGKPQGSTDRQSNIYMLLQRAWSQRSAWQR